MFTGNCRGQQQKLSCNSSTVCSFFCSAEAASFGCALKQSNIIYIYWHFSIGEHMHNRIHTAPLFGASESEYSPQLSGTLMWCGIHLINRGSHLHRWRSNAWSDSFKVVQSRDCSLGRLSQRVQIAQGRKGVFSHDSDLNQEDISSFLTNLNWKGKQRSHRAADTVCSLCPKSQLTSAAMRHTFDFGVTFKVVARSNDAT